MNQLASYITETHNIAYTYDCSLSSIYWKPTRPSIEPMAYPLALGKALTQRVCHFSGDCEFCMNISKYDRR